LRRGKPKRPIALRVADSCDRLWGDAPQFANGLRDKPDVGWLVALSTMWHGVRYGQSVSSKIRSSGTRRTASRNALFAG